MDRLTAWDRLHAALAAREGWRASPPQYHADRRLWRATAFDGRHYARGKGHEAVDAEGATEAEAVDQLARLLEIQPPTARA
jgi:hypothetical protein